MPTPTDPAPGTLLDGTAPTGGEVNRKIYHPSALGTFDSLEGMNGEVDRVNLATSAIPIPARKIMVGAASSSHGVGATANVDFFGDLLFPHTVRSVPGSSGGWTYAKAQNPLYLKPLETYPVPNLTDVIKNPFSIAQKIRISWGVSFVVGPPVADQKNGYDADYYGTPTTNTVAIIDKGAEVHQGFLQLYINDVPHPTCLMPFGAGAGATRPSENYEDSPCNNPGAWNDHYDWEFSCVVDASVVAEMGLGANSPLLKGMHSVDIRCWTKLRILRFKTRSLHWTVVN
jgi:hypothetical protein